MDFKDFSNPELVSIAVYLLGGDTYPIDREDIAIKVNEIAPGRFCWRKYPQYIDLDAVGVALRDAKKPKNGGFLVGNNSEGWMLSPIGLKRFRNIDFSLIDRSEFPQYRRDSISANIENEAIRLKSTRAYHLYLAGDLEKIGLQDFFQFVRINEYFHGKSRSRRISVIDNAVVDDEDLLDLWNLLKNKFSKEIERNG